jgi:endonuclease/exonuclease/phosphatase family metal-dependent hydrolase
MSTSFKIVTWNVENLFRPSSKATRAERERYEAKLAFLAKTLRKVKADVIALQEVGGDGALADLQAALGATYRHRRIGKPDGRGIAGGFVSTLAFRAREDVTGVPSPGRALRVSDLAGAPLRHRGRGALRVRGR